MAIFRRFLNIWHGLCERDAPALKKVVLERRFNKNKGLNQTSLNPNEKLVEPGIQLQLNRWQFAYRLVMPLNMHANPGFLRNVCTYLQIIVQRRTSQVY